MTRHKKTTSWGRLLFILLLTVTVADVFAEDRAVTDESSLDTWLNSATVGDRLLLTPTPPPDFLQIQLSGTLSASVDNLILDGNLINGDSGYILGNRSFNLLDFTGYSINSVVNLEMNDGVYSGPGSNDHGGALTADSITGDLRNVAFRRNSTTSQTGGGAIYIEFDMNGNIASDVHFDANTAVDGSGGALFVGNDFLGSIDGTGGDVHFDRNTSYYDGGGMFVAQDFGSGNSFIYATYFADNEAETGSGGGLYVGNDFNADLRAYSFFVNNKAGAHGGGMFVGQVLNGTIMGARFTGNEAGRSGGALWIEQMDGDIGGGTTFENNTAGEQGGAILVAGLGIGPYDDAMRGNISASFLNNSAGQEGGAIAIGGIVQSGMAGNISGSTFTGNTAGTDAGAIHFSGNFTGDITNTTFTNNTATAGKGGALYMGGFTGTIADTTFTGNSAGTSGGAIYFDTSFGGDGFDITLSASAGNMTSFSGNTSSAGENSFYVGTGIDPYTGNPVSSSNDFTMRIGGSGTVAFYDPFQVAMDNGHNFSFTHDAPNANLILSGTNMVETDGGTATMHFLQGTTQVPSQTSGIGDFTTIFTGDTSVDIRFGSNHTLAIIDMADRDNYTALFDLTGVGAGATKNFVIESGSTLDITRLLKPLENNRYLLVSGLDPNNVVVQGEFNYLHPDGYTKVPVYENNNTEIWLDDIVVSDAFDPGVVSPNAVRGENCLTTWLNGTSAGLSLTSDQVLALRADFESAVPEAAVSMAVINLDTHTTAVNAANQHAFGLGRGGLGDFNTAGIAVANPGAESRGIIAGWNPVAKRTASENAVAQLRESTPRGLRFWSGYMGGFNRTRQVHRYSGYNVDTHGFLTGLVWDRGETLSFGLYGGYSRGKTDFRDIHAKAKTESGHFGLHTAIDTDWGLRTVVDASYTHASNKLERTPGNLGTTKGRFKHDIVSAGVNFEYDLYVSPQARIAPLASFSGAWLRQGSFDESGPYLAAHVKKFNKTTFQSLIGFSMAHDFIFGEDAMVTPSFSAGWKHTYGANSFDARYYFLDNVSGGVTPGGCLVQSRERGRDSALIGAAVDALFNTGGTQWGLKAAYNFEAGRKRINHNMFLGAELRF